MNDRWMNKYAGTGCIKIIYHEELGKQQNMILYNDP